MTARVLTRIGIRLLAFMLLLTCGACLPPKSVSQVKTLNNFANGTATLSHCGLDLVSDTAVTPVQKRWVGQIIAPTDAQRLAVLSALTAVPQLMQAPFFNARGRIVVTDDTPSICGRLPLSAGERAFAGQGQPTVSACWRQDVAGQPPLIYLRGSTDLVRSDLVRTFAYLYEELFVERLEQIAPTANNAQLSQALSGFVTARKAVSDALMADAPSLGAGVPQRLRSFQRLDPKRFDAFALAEAVDSFYCSPATSQAFQHDFPATYQAFSGKAGLAGLFGLPWYQ